MINSVNGLCIGQVFNVEGRNFIVTSFPTHYSVCGKGQDIKSAISGIKTSINNTRTLFWQHNKTGSFICPTNPY